MNTASFAGALVVRIYLKYLHNITYKIEHKNKQTVTNPQYLFVMRIYLPPTEYGENISIYDDGYKAMND